MLYLLVILALSGESLSVRPPCCLPSQWEANEGFTMVSMKDGKVSKGWMQISYDGLNQRIAASEIISGGRIKIIQLYQENLEFVLINNTCVKTVLNRPWGGKCLPSNSSAQLNSHYGLGVNNTLDFTTYYVPLDQTGQTWLFVTVTHIDKDTCIPISEQKTVFPPDMSMTSTAFWNMKRGIADEIFTVPTECHNVETNPQPIPPFNNTNFHKRNSVWLP